MSNDQYADATMNQSSDVERANGADESESPLEMLQVQDWEDLTKRLIAYARFRMCRVISARNSGNGPEDYAQLSIVLLFEGKRRFCPDDGRSLFSFLCGVIDSVISHDAEKVRRRVADGTVEISIGNNDHDDSRVEQVSEDHLRAGSFESELETRDHLEHFTHLLDAPLRAYVRLLAEESHITAKECAAALGTSEQMIRNMDRQLSRKRKLYEICWRHDPHATRMRRTAFT